MPTADAAARLGSWPSALPDPATAVVTSASQSTVHTKSTAGTPPSGKPHAARGDRHRHAAHDDRHDPAWDLVPVTDEPEGREHERAGDHGQRAIGHRSRDDEADRHRDDQHHAARAARPLPPGAASGRAEHPAEDEDRDSGDREGDEQPAHPWIRRSSDARSRAGEASEESSERPAKASVGRAQRAERPDIRTYRPSCGARGRARPRPEARRSRSLGCGANEVSKRPRGVPSARPVRHRQPHPRRCRDVTRRHGAGARGSRRRPRRGRAEGSPGDPGRDRSAPAPP